jgi:hypothetical protein
MLDFDVNLLNEEQRFALLFGILLGDGCLSCYLIKNKKKSDSNNWKHLR